MTWLTACVHVCVCVCVCVSTDVWKHWGYQLTQRDADEYVKSKNLPELPRPVKRSADRALDDIKKRCKTNINE